MPVVDLSQSSDSEREGGMQPSQDGASAKEKREWGVRECAVYSCWDTFLGAIPMLYHIWRDHPGGHS